MSNITFTLLTPFSIISKISISVNHCNFTLVFCKAACHANSSAEIK